LYPDDLAFIFLSFLIFVKYPNKKIKPKIKLYAELSRIKFSRPEEMPGSPPTGS